MKTKVIGLGAGGHARVLMEILDAMGNFEIVGLLDAEPGLHGRNVLGVPVMGGDDMMGKLAQQGVTHFFLGLGSVGDASLRRRLFQRAVDCGLEPAQAVHPRAIISPSARLGAGVAIMAGVIINSGANLETNVIVNTGAVIEHDCVIGAHAHIAPGACLAGGVSVGEGSHIGIGASVRQNIRIGRNAIVGAGAAVVKDVADEAVVAGVPARRIRAATSRKSHSQPIEAKG